MKRRDLIKALSALCGMGIGAKTITADDDNISTVGIFKAHYRITEPNLIDLETNAFAYDNDYLEVVFPEPICALKIKIIEGSSSTASVGG